MALVEYHLQINATPEQVYEVSQDYAVRKLWDPFPERIDFLHGATEIQKGTQVLVIAKSGLRMEVEFVQVAPPEAAAIVMKKGPMILKHFAGSWVFKTSQDIAHMTDAKFKYSIKTQWWSLPIISEPIACLYFKYIVKARLQGLKNYIEQNPIKKDI